MLLATITGAMLDYQLCAVRNINSAISWEAQIYLNDPLPWQDVWKCQVSIEEIKAAKLVNLGWDERPQAFSPAWATSCNTFNHTFLDRRCSSSTKQAVLVDCSGANGTTIVRMEVWHLFFHCTLYVIRSTML